ncbi:hypothetical protein GCM10022251_03810 [Phytohabitans flavus]|uniref:MinD/ParA family ATP-binding protein n=1 Tax=Phytohabitans flavus TaxID=1076124 RepID=UPI0031E880D2
MDEERSRSRHVPVGPNRGVKPLWPTADYVAEEEVAPAPVAPPPPLPIAEPFPPAGAPADPPPSPAFGGPEGYPQPPQEPVVPLPASYGQPAAPPAPVFAPPPEPQGWVDGNDNLPPGVWHLASTSPQVEPPTPVHNGPPITTTPPAGIPVSSGHHTGGVPFPSLPPTSAPPVTSSPPAEYAPPIPSAPPASAPPVPSAPPAQPSTYGTPVPDHFGPPAPAYGHPASAPPASAPLPSVQPGWGQPPGVPPAYPPGGGPPPNGVPQWSPAQPAPGPAPNGGGAGWGPPPDEVPTNNQPLQPPADPWAGSAPLNHPAGSPWASPPGQPVPPGAAPTLDHSQPATTDAVPTQPTPSGHPGPAAYPVHGWVAGHPGFAPGQGEPATLPTQPGAGHPYQVHPGVTAMPPQPEAPGVHRVPPQPYQEQPVRQTEPGVPTAEEFARRRAVRPPEPMARTGMRAAVNKSTLGLVKLAPGRHEQEFRQDVEKVRRNFGGLRQVTVVNPKGGAGKTVAVLLLAMTFGQKRGGYVLAWDNNETQGTLGMRAQQDFHSRTVRDMLRDLSSFQGARGRVGDLSQYVRAQGEGMFDVLASDESATAGEMLTAHAFGEIREVVSRFYKLIFVDTGNNVRAQNWQAAIDATDQLVVTMSARNDSAEPAARMLDHLEQSGRTRLVRQAVTVVSMPPRAKDIDLAPIQRHFEARTRAVLLAPYDRVIDTGEPMPYGQLSTATLDAWLKVAAAVSEGL